MSAMSASSGLMPLSLISEHKAAQGGPTPVQPLNRTPEKHSLAQAPKPTPNGMEPSSPLNSFLPLPQSEPQPSLPCGGKSEAAEEDGSGDNTPVIQIPAAEPALPSFGTVPEQLLASEPPTLQSGAPDLPVSQAPSSLIPAPVSPPEAPTPNLLSNSTPQQPLPEDLPAEPEMVPQSEAVPTPEPAQVPQSEPQSVEEDAKTSEKEDNVTEKQESMPTSSTTEVSVAKSQKTPDAPATRPSKRTKQSSNNAVNDKKVVPSEEDASGDDRKPKRKRLPTQPYQSPIPELNLIAKFSKIDKTPSASADDKLIVFYRNEFLAVRNADGGFYVCQAMQNVYKNSISIKIRWLSQLANTDNYSPDFYDHTEFDCILTNLNLKKVDKNKYQLPEEESQRTQSILKRAIDVEKGIAPPEETSITEEHPDGLDVSLYRNEDQLKKKKGGSSKSKPNKKNENSENPVQGTTRSSSRKSTRSDSISKNATTVPSQQRRSGRPVKVEKPIVQRIVEAKKVVKKKSAVASASKTTKKETKPSSAVKRKADSQLAPVPDKKIKSGGSKTKSGVVGGPNQRARRSTTRAK